MTGSDKIKSKSHSSNSSLSKSLSNKKMKKLHQEMLTGDRRKHNATIVSPIKNVQSFDKLAY